MNDLCTTYVPPSTIDFSALEADVVYEYLSDKLGWDKNIFAALARLSQIQDQEFQKTNFIDIEYTDDDCGQAAREMGIIEHAYEGDAGIDLPIMLEPGSRELGSAVMPDDRVLLRTGMKMAFPKGYWGLIIHRSSTERKYKLRVVEGVIDEYRNELLVQLHNTSPDPVFIQHQQRLGQLILVKTASFKARVVDKLSPSQRGEKGFGSTGA